MSWSSDGRYLAASTTKGTVHIWKLEAASVVSEEAVVTKSQPQALLRIRISIAPGLGSMILGHAQKRQVENLDNSIYSDLPFHFEHHQPIVHTSADTDSNPLPVFSYSKSTKKRENPSPTSVDGENNKVPYLKRLSGINVIFDDEVIHSSDSSAEVRDVYCINSRGFISEETTSIHSFSAAESVASTPHFFPRSSSSAYNFLGSKAKGTVTGVLSLHRVYITKITTETGGQRWSNFDPVSSLSSYFSTAIAAPFVGASMAANAVLGSREADKPGPKPTAEISEINLYRAHVEDLACWNLHE